MAKIKHGLQTTMDGVYLFTAQGCVSGSAGGGDMTGSLVLDAGGTTYKSTDPVFTVMYGSGSLRNVANQPLPTGSMRLVMANPAAQILAWNVTWECSGVHANQAYDPTGGPSAYFVRQYGHNALVSGTTTFDFGFGHFSGSTTNAGFNNFVPAVPQDKARSTSMAGRWTLTAWLRKSTRGV